MKDCECEPPSRHPALHKRHKCVKCDLHINPAWDSNDANLTAFFNLLTSSPECPESIADFIDRCETREKAGREAFGHRYLARDNIAECAEELADALIYIYLDQLREVREGQRYDTRDVAFKVAHHLAHAYQGLADMARRRRGAP